VGRLCSGAVRKPGIAWYVFAAFAANAPDLDFLPGILVDTPFAFHRGLSHSLFAAVIFGAIILLLTRHRLERPWAVAGAATAGYASYLLLDMPQIPVLWPMSFNFPTQFWPSLSLSLPWSHSGGLTEFLGIMFSPGFAYVALIETAVFLPVVVVAWLVPKWRGARSGAEDSLSVEFRTDAAVGRSMV